MTSLSMLRLCVCVSVCVSLMALQICSTCSGTDSPCFIVDSFSPPSFPPSIKFYLNFGGTFKWKPVLFTYIFLCFMLSLPLSLVFSVPMPVGILSALRCLLTGPLSSFVSTHPFIPPSGQSLPVLPDGRLLPRLWNETVPCCIWHLAWLRPLQPSALSFYCKNLLADWCIHKVYRECRISLL